MTISATKPPVVPRWATVSPGTSRLEPSSGLKDTGWVDGQRPAFNEMNWLQGVIYDWQQYLEDATDQLESSKINKTGATDLSGTFQPTADNGASLGLVNKRFNNGFFSNLIAGVLGVTTLDVSVLRSAPTTKTLISSANQAVGVSGSFHQVSNPFGTATVRELTGAGVGQLLFLQCAVNSAQSLVLVHTAPGSATVGRINLVGGANVTIPAGGFIALMPTTHPTSGALYWQELFRVV